MRDVFIIECEIGTLLFVYTADDLCGSAHTIPVSFGRAKKIISEQVTGGTQRFSLTVAVFRPWRGLAGSAAPGLPGRWQGYSK